MRNKVERSLMSIALLLFPAFVGMAQAASSYIPLVGQEYSNYKTTYSPDRLLVEGAEVTLTTQVGNLSNDKLRLFFPPGTKRLYVSMSTYRVEQDARAAVRFKQPPVSVYAAVTQEAFSATSSATSNLSKVAETLVSGTELKFYSPPLSGALSFSQPLATDSYKSNEGGWVYFNMLSIPGGSIYNLQTRIVVDKNCYEQWYAASTTSWDTANNPSEDATHVCGNAPTLTGITPSTTQLTYGSSQTATLSPVPSSASLGSCSFSPATAPLSIAGSTVSLTSATTAPSADIPVTITCSGKTTSITVKASTQEPLTSITLSASQLTYGSTQTSTITASPSGASLGTCSFSPATAPLAISNSTISLVSSSSPPTSDTSVTISCSGKTQTLTVKPAVQGALVSIALSEQELTFGSSHTLTITPSPANAALGTCTFSPTTAPLQVSGSTVSLVNTATAPTSDTTVSVTCTGKSASFTLKPAGTSVSESVTGNGLKLDITLRPVAADVGKQATIWLAAKLPSDGALFQGALWFFNTGTGWVMQDVGNPAAMAFKTNETLSTSSVYTLNTGLEKTLMTQHGLEIYIGYQTAGDAFKSIGKIWPVQ